MFALSYLSQRSLVKDMQWNSVIMQFMNAVEALAIMIDDDDD